MYAGHLAAGLAIRGREPRLPLWAALVGVGWLDIVHGALVLVGAEHVHPELQRFLGWQLDDVPWSHSLVAAIAWSLLALVVARRWGRGAAIALALGVFSHFVLDFPMHEHDLALAPGCDVRLGLGLWAWSAVGAWLVEGALVAACCAYYLRRGGKPAVVLVVAALHVSFYPALSPLRFAALHLG